MEKTNTDTDDDTSPVQIRDYNNKMQTRVIRKALEYNPINNKVVTALSIGFKKSRQEQINAIPRKHRDLLARIQAIDGNAYLETNYIQIEDPTEIPDGEEYKKLFNDGQQIYRGRVYIGCTLHSSYTIGQLKWSPVFGLMDWLKTENIHLSEKRYDHLAEASIGFIPDVNPAVVLRSEIRNTLDYCLETIDLKTREEKMLEEFTPEEKKDKEDTLFSHLIM